MGGGVAADDDGRVVTCPAWGWEGVLMMVVTVVMAGVLGLERGIDDGGGNGDGGSLGVRMGY